MISTDDFNIDELEIAKLSEENLDDLANFDCSGDWKPDNQDDEIIKEGEEDINNFLRHDAYIQQQQGMNTTYLFYYNNNIVAFVSLTADSIKLSNKEKKKSELPYRDVPAVKIGRLGADYRFKKRGIGTFVINFVKAMAYNLSQGLDVRGEPIGTSMGIRYLTLDSYKHNIDYYMKQDFVKNQSDKYADQETVSMRYDLF